MNEQPPAFDFEALRQKAAAFPVMSGVYLMRDEEGDVIYVGKAINLRARVRTYFQGGDGRAQIEFLMRKVRTIENIVTQTEQQAFLLERDLIGKYKPRYNIRLKDDRSYLSIRIDEDQDWPRVEVVRKIEQDGARYFGPYSFSHELRSLVEIIKRAVPLRTCSNTVFHNRQRPCLEYQIHRCAGPCTIPVDRDQYRKWVRQAISILEGKSSALAQQLTKDMEQAAQELRFEDAATMRDRINVLTNTKELQPIVTFGGESRDVFAFEREEKLATVAVLVVRWGRVTDSVNFSFADVQVTDDELLEAVISQFYDSGRELPDEIVVPMALENQGMLSEAMSAKRERKVEVLDPKRGIRARLIGLAELNARQHYLSTFDAETRYLESARELAKLLQLKQIPRRIEVVDISNFQESDIVGALVSFFDGHPDKKRYRNYKLSVKGKPDDFASIREVVSRRIQRGIQEEDLPDLLIIDGGPGQLAAACGAREEAGISLEIVSLAKMKTESAVHSRVITKSSERIYLEFQSEPVVLSDDQRVTHLVQRMRDEVHRFAITFHRKTRAKRVFRSVLDEIPGLGPERRGRLMRAYGSVARMKSVAPDEFAKTGRMPLSLATKVLAILNDPAASKSRTS